MQIRCSKKGCKNHEKCSKMHPKWEQKSTKILKKTRFKNVLVFGINFRRPLVPKMLAKWSPTRRTSSRKPNRKGKQQEGNSQDSLPSPTRPRRGGGAPGPERTFEYRRALWPSKNALWEGVRKKHENCMKNRCQNRRFLMAQNHVWRYTLRLFHTFGIYEKKQIDEQMMKIQHKKWSVLMARNHVWRYTLRLFHTFAIFEQIRTIYAKRDAKSRVF